MIRSSGWYWASRTALRGSVVLKFRRVVSHVTGASGHVCTTSDGFMDTKVTASLPLGPVLL
jgi:hypothetical protein